MGTVADKLNYLNDTKKEIKQAIERTGTVVPTGMKFRQYAQKIDEVYPDALFLDTQKNNLVLKEYLSSFHSMAHGNNIYMLCCEYKSTNYVLVGTEKTGFVRKSVPSTSSKKKVIFCKDAFFLLMSGSGTFGAYRSVDGNEWQKVVTFNGDEKYYENMGYINGEFFIYSARYNHALRSYDGITWSRFAINLDFNIDFYGFKILQHDEKNNRLWALMSGSAAKPSCIVYSSDGINFKKFIYSDKGELRPAFYASGNIIIYANGSKVYFSNDKGVTFRECINKSENNSNSFSINGYTYKNSKILFNGSFYLLVEDTEAYVSDDGINWESVALMRRNRGYDSLVKDDKFMVLCADMLSNDDKSTLLYSYNGSAFQTEINAELHDKNKNGKTGYVLDALNGINVNAMSVAYAEGVNDIVNTK